MLEKLFTPKRETWLYKVNPAFKLVIFLMILFIILFNKNLAFVSAQMIFYAILLYTFSGYSWKQLFIFSIPIIISFLSSFITMMLFGKGTNIWWQWGIIKISKESFFYGLLLGSKTLCFGFTGLIFLLTIRPTLLFYALMQQFKLSPKYAYSFLASFRLLPIIVEELQMRNNALKIRGVTYAKGFKGILQRLQLFSIPLFAQSIRRAQRIAVAMESKRFQMDGKRTYFYPTSYTKIDGLFLTILIIAFILSYLLIDPLSPYLISNP